MAATMTLPENISRLKTVFLHDWLVSHRGGERALQGLIENHPDAPIYTLVHKKGSVSKELEAHNIVTSFLQKVPGAISHHRYFLPLMPTAATAIKLPSTTELMFSSSHCVIKGVPKPNDKCFHVCYIHSPMRYLYDQYESYFGPGAPLLNRLGMRVFKDYLTVFDQSTNAGVDLFLANSNFVQDRVARLYGRDSVVVNGFIDHDDFADLQKKTPRREDFFLIVSAFAPNKKIDLAIEAFNRNGLPLKIIGSGQEEVRLRSIANKNIQFLGSRSRQEVIEHFFRARAFVFPGVEDFGLTPIESVTAGTPVIAFNVGGATETLNDKVAQFFSEPTVDGLNNAIETFAKRSFDLDEMQTISLKYTKSNFLKKVYEAVTRAYEKFTRHN